MEGGERGGGGLKGWMGGGSVGIAGRVKVSFLTV